MAAEDRKLKALGFNKPANDDWFLGHLDEDDLRRVFSKSIESLRGIIKRVMIIEAGKKMTITAIALERYRMRHGNLPEDLSGLVPEFLTAIPRDPVDGRALRYHRSANETFLLYSVGEDAVDNGGDPTTATASWDTYSWSRGRDWV
jgi:hypothetical protein